MFRSDITHSTLLAGVLPTDMVKQKKKKTRQKNNKSAFCRAIHDYVYFYSALFSRAVDFGLLSYPASVALHK